LTNLTDQHEKLRLISMKVIGTIDTAEDSATMRADIIKRLFQSYKSGDDRSFVEAARELIQDERKKHHIILANELAELLDNTPAFRVQKSLTPLPKDSDRGSPLVDVFEPQRYLSDIVLDEEQLSILTQVAEEFRSWDVLLANGVTPSQKLLFCGPPGCGKTVTAEAICSELELPLVYVKFDAVISSLLGETATNLRKVFDFASSLPCVLFFDEFDAVGRTRDDPGEHGELKRVVNTFLQMLDHFRARCIVIAATNFEQALDPALWRRFDEVVRFEKPTRKQIDQLMTKRLGAFSSVRMNEPALKRLLGMSHADIERICLDAIKKAVMHGRTKVTIQEIEQAILKQDRRRQALLKSRNRPALSDF
jgi:SpoVK/Ycf46/Vps4 family AAA+-type ATPase